LFLITRDHNIICVNRTYMLTGKYSRAYKGPN